MEKSKIAKAVMVSLVSAALAGGAVSAMAASEKHIKCYGIAKKGKNDCGTSHHACAGQATKDDQPNEWVYAKKADCLKKGGSIDKPES